MHKLTNEECEEFALLVRDGAFVTDKPELDLSGPWTATRAFEFCGLRYHPGDTLSFDFTDTRH